MLTYMHESCLLGIPSGAPLLEPPVVINFTAVRLSWEEVNCTQRNGVIIGYNIRYYADQESQLITVLHVTDTTGTTISGLEKFNVYQISVAAININGVGPYSQEFLFHTC